MDTLLFPVRGPKGGGSSLGCRPPFGVVVRTDLVCRCGGSREGVRVVRDLSYLPTTGSPDETVCPSRLSGVGGRRG